MDSILTSIKKMLGIAEEYTHFDSDLTIHINTVLSILTQVGVGPSKGYFIMDKTQTWTEFLPISEKRLGLVKSYVYMKVKLLFDPPLSSAVIESTNKLIAELEWRILVSIETIEKEGGFLLNNYLKHFGILGMKWGVRRSEAQLSNARTRVDATNNIVREIKNVQTTTGNLRSTVKSPDLETMTDAELKDRVNRLNMEQQYSKLTTGQKSNGEVYARSTLELAGSALAITSSALAIAIAIKQLKG